MSKGPAYLYSLMRVSGAWGQGVRLSCSLVALEKTLLPSSFCSWLIHFLPAVALMPCVLPGCQAGAALSHWGCLPSVCDIFGSFPLRDSDGRPNPSQALDLWLSPQWPAGENTLLLKGPMTSQTHPECLCYDLTPVEYYFNFGFLFSLGRAFQSGKMRESPFPHYRYCIWNKTQRNFHSGMGLI